VASARRIYLLGLGLGGLGAAALVLAVWVSLGAVTLSPPSVGALVAACGRLISPTFSGDALLTLTLMAPGLAAFGLGSRSLLRHFRAHRRFANRVDVVTRVDIDGDEVLVLEDSRPQAFCAGYLRPRIYVSSGALALLSDAELGAVVAHERHHRTRRDPLRLLVFRTLSESLFFLPVLGRLGTRYGVLAEMEADQVAARERGRGTLASALLAFGESRAPHAAVGIAPERVDHLLGGAARWELPVALLVGSLLAALGLGAAAVAASGGLGSPALNLPLMLSQSCTAAMVMVPVFVAVGALLAARPVHSSR